MSETVQTEHSYFHSNNPSGGGVDMDDDDSSHEATDMVSRASFKGMFYFDHDMII